MDILKNFKVSCYPSGKEPVELVLYFDSGSPYTFIKQSSALKVGRLSELVEPASFSGLGGGDFQSKESIHLYVNLLEFWCRHWTYVVEDDLLGKCYDVLTGHDFMQRYGIKLLPRQGDIEIDEVILDLAQRVR
jgi:hypothetical protein